MTIWLVYLNYGNFREKIVDAFCERQDAYKEAKRLNGENRRTSYYHVKSYVFREV